MKTSCGYSETSHQDTFNEYAHVFTEIQENNVLDTALFCS